MPKGTITDNVSYNLGKRTLLLRVRDGEDVKELLFEIDHEKKFPFRPIIVKEEV